MPIWYPSVEREDVLTQAQQILMPCLRFWGDDTSRDNLGRLLPFCQRTGILEAPNPMRGRQAYRAYRMIFGAYRPPVLTLLSPTATMISRGKDWLAATPAPSPAFDERARCAPAPGERADPATAGAGGPSVDGNRHPDYLLC